MTHPSKITEIMISSLYLENLLIDIISSVRKYGSLIGTSCAWSVTICQAFLRSSVFSLGKKEC